MGDRHKKSDIMIAILHMNIIKTLMGYVMHCTGKSLSGWYRVGSQVFVITIV